MSEQMLEISYSVAIRTLGTAGEKYVKLMDSIQKLEPQPKEVIVVIPEQYAEPAYQIGIEKFVRSPKGMIIQRLAALNIITSDYILFCDDDVEFESNFVQKLYEPMNMGYACSAGPLLDFFPPAGVKYLVASLLGGACVMLHGKEKMYTRILNTGGWSYNRDIKTDEHRIYDAESLAWTCFFINAKAMRAIHFEDEMWIEQNGYAAFDDRVMFYKLIMMGYKSCVVSDAVYIHNDAMTSTKDLKLEPIYARAFNHYMFWYKFLYAPESSWIMRAWKKFCINYYVVMQKIYSRINKMPDGAYLEMCKGFSDAMSRAKELR